MVTLEKIPHGHDDHMEKPHGHENHMENHMEKPHGKTTWFFSTGRNC